jgi:predicted O-methyltransferase YrrM
MELINAAAEAFADKYSSPESELLSAIVEATQKNHPKAHMLSGHVQGRLLAFLSRLVTPRYILEIGTFTGYSALCLCEGLRHDGELHTIESREEEVVTAQENFNKSSYTQQIHLHYGEAASIIPHLNITWDLVFIDADKTGYMAYYDMVMPRLRSGGLLIADNIFFHGQVLDENNTAKNPVAMREFTQRVAADANADRLILTVRDGLLLAIKK